MTTIILLAFILLPVFATDIKEFPLNNEDNALWDRLLQVDGLSIPPNLAPTRPAGPISAGKMSKSNNGGMSKSKKGGMGSGGMSSGGTPAIPTMFPQERTPVIPTNFPNNGIPPNLAPTRPGDMSSGGTPAIPTMFPQERTPVIPTNFPNNGNTSQRPVLGPNMTVMNSRFVPICKRDASGSFLEYNDPRYDSPETEIVLSEMTTFGSTDDALMIVMESLDAVATVASSLPDIFEFSMVLLGRFATVAAVAGIVSVGLNLLGPLFGIGGESADDAILNAVTEGFSVVNMRLTDIQNQIRQSFVDLKTFIGDVELDGLSADLESTMRQYNIYVNSTNETRIQYDASLRAYCNEPFRSPEDIFYNLYGYACEKCAFAPRKRADVRQAIIDSLPSSQAQFRTRFSSFILLSMYNAMFLHAVCLPPVEGLCVDRSTDVAWRDGVTRMQAAFNETVEFIGSIERDLGNWVMRFGIDQIRESISASQGDNRLAAENIVMRLSREQPNFHIQALVRDRGGSIQNLFRSGCNGNEGQCPTDRSDTGHYWYDFDEKTVSIRYRLKSLPLPLTTIDNEFFGDFYNRINTRLNRDNIFEIEDETRCGIEAERVQIVGNFFPSFIPACFVPQCFFCDQQEQALFDNILNPESYYIIERSDNFNVAEFSSNATMFPRFVALFDGPYTNDGFPVFLVDGDSDFDFYFT